MGFKGLLLSQSHKNPIIFSWLYFTVQLWKILCVSRDGFLQRTNYPTIHLVSEEEEEKPIKNRNAVKIYLDIFGK